MPTLYQMSQPELEQFYQVALSEYEACAAKGLSLDMTRGKPSSKQVDLSNGIFDVGGDYIMDGMDVRNYGELSGLPSCRRYFAELLNVAPSEVFVGGNSSLNLMYDVIAKAYTHGLLHSEKPWSQLDEVKFLCPVPGYDRHFNLTQSFGMTLIPVPMLEDGPDMDQIDALVQDPAVKGIWCVPKFSNPQGIIFSERVLSRFASLKPAASDFTIMWDNAYCVHEFDGGYQPFADILSLCREADNSDMVFEFASTSKITFPGAGVSCFACSEANMKHMLGLLTFQTISYDKLNQYNHVRFLQNKTATLAHMKKLAEVMKPKFDAVLDALDQTIAPLGFASYLRPKGGYFISLDTLPGCAKRTHALAKQAGVNMTPAGATFPYGIDPQDSNLRIAPSYPPIDELHQAVEVFCVALKLAAAEKLLGKI